MAKYDVVSLTPAERRELLASVQQRRVASQRRVRAQCLLAGAPNGLGWPAAQPSPA